MKKLIISALILGLPLLGQAQITVKKLLKENKRVSKQYDNVDEVFPEKRLTMLGQMSMGAFEIPCKVYALDEAFRMDFTLMGASFYMVDTDTLNWAYDPFNERHTFTKSDGEESEEDGGIDFTSQDAVSSLMADGYEPESVTESVILDSIEVYSLRFVKPEKRDEFVYFDKESYLSIGQSSGESEQFFLGSKIIRNVLFPAKIVMMSPDQVMTVDIDTYDFETEIDPGLFQMSKEDRRAYLKFLKEQEKPEVSPIQRLYDKGEALYAEGKYEEAIAEYDKALKLNAEDEVVLNARGLAKSESGNQYGAIADYERALESDPKYADAYSNRGLAKSRLNDYAGAIVDYKKAISLDSTTAVYYFNVGSAYIDQGEYEKSLSYFDDAIVIDSSESDLFYYRGFSKAQLGQYETALADYDKAEELGIDGAYFHNYRGVTQYNLSLYEEALDSFETAWSQDSTDMQFIQNVGMTQRALERYHEAIKTFEQILATDTTNAEILVNIGLCESDLGLYKVAIKRFDKALEYVNNNAYYYDYRGYANMELGNYTGAIEDFTNSLDLDQDPNIYYHRGLAKIYISNKSQACMDFKKAADMDFENGKTALTEHCNLR